MPAGTGSTMPTAPTGVDSLSWVSQVGLRAHEDSIMSLMGQFLARGAPGGGWLALLGAPGAIRGHCPRRGWCSWNAAPTGPPGPILEYERTARGEARVQRKLRSYGSVRRGDHWPVLLVCWDESAESNFQQVGLRTYIPMLTTTIDRAGGVRAAGQPAVLVHLRDSGAHRVVGLLHCRPPGLQGMMALMMSTTML